MDRPSSTLLALPSPPHVAVMRRCSSIIAVGKDRPDVAVLRPRAPRSETPPAEAAVARSASVGKRVAAAADHYLEHAPRGFRDDCSGFVMAATHRAGVPMTGSTRDMFEALDARGLIHSRRRPQLGDLVFFDNTYDRDRNGRWDDELTHIGVVIAVHSDDTVVVAHAGTSAGRTTMKMNLRHPDARTDARGAVINDWLRSRSSRDPEHAQHLSGQLWRAFATLTEDGDAWVSAAP